jgi:hypothetical protein
VTSLDEFGSVSIRNARRISQNQRPILPVPAIRSPAELGEALFPHIANGPQVFMQWN